MAIDPKAAATALQRAAAEARAAAEMAAANAVTQAASSQAAAEGMTAAEAGAAAGAEADGGTGAKAPTLAESAARQAVEDTEATGAGAGLLDSAAMARVTDRETDLLGDSARESFASLPGLESAISGAANSGVESPFDLGSSFQSNESPGIGTDSISTVFRVNIEKDDAVLVKRPVDNTVPGDTSGDTGGSQAPNPLPPGVKPTGGSTTGGSTTGGTTTGGTTTGGTTTGGTTTGGSGAAGGGASGSGAAGGGAGGDVPVDEAPFVPPPGWVDLDDLDFVPGERTPGPAVAGATGQDPNGDGEDESLPGPQGGSWAINPGAEGFVAGRETDLRDAEAWYGGLSQPGSPDLQDNTGGNPQILDQGMPTVNPETVNPGSGDADTADAGAQASTAYRTTAAPAGSMPGSDAAAGQGPADVATGHAPADDAIPAWAEPTDPGLGLPALDDDDASGSGHGRGREFGQEQGQGRGRDHEEDEEA